MIKGFKDHFTNTSRLRRNKLYTERNKKPSRYDRRFVTLVGLVSIILYRMCFLKVIEF